VFSGSLKVRTEENIEPVQCRMKDESQLSLGQLSLQTEVSVSTCQRIVRKDLEDSATAEKYRNNIFDVFINQLDDDELGICDKTGLQPIQHVRLFVICGNFLTIG
jgi:hypothetical protein